ncbi:hypothetical protein FZEAL_4286 [Fusarium zealandicum]|uniref:Protein tyrosine phosphatase n=1 Tax=Fusarium zealandicum TaxID=1053134 RepID=A0A8H4UMT7_9HYPO|nr:hypothetical protein FZEAL_4286 [Fusarium zealandicum]
MYSWNRRRHWQLFPHVRDHGHVSLVGAIIAAVPAVPRSVLVGAASGSENLDYHRDSPPPVRRYPFSYFSSFSSSPPLLIPPPSLLALFFPPSLLLFLLRLRFAEDYATIKRFANVQDYSSSLTRIRSLPDLHQAGAPDAYPLLSRKSSAPLPPSSRALPLLRARLLALSRPSPLRNSSSRASLQSSWTYDAMDRIPKFRRKPKKPTIETAVERSSSDTADSIASSELQAANLQLQQQGLQQAQSQKQAAKLSKRAAFRNFRLRGSAKRARDSPPTELPSSPPHAVVSHDGIKSRPATAEGNALGSQDGAGPKIPAFLDSTMQDIDFKFQELTWAERDRVLEGTRNEADDEFKWGTFKLKQVDIDEKGLMDRYINIKPWNHNRIRLQVPTDELNYVNASEIILSSPSNAQREPLSYIAMQGPTVPSIDYVWRMIAEQMSSPAVIVQLTTMFESGVTKCHQYFPDDEDHPTWTLNENNVWNDDWQGQITHDSYEELLDGAIEKRKLLMHLKDEDEPRVVWHLLYRKWPDFGVPELEDLDSFFELMRLSRELSAPSNPRIIHCSAGVGRTGTFITLEHLMRELEAGTFANYDEPTEGPDLVFETVDILREQRVGMVQGRPQYQFIYQVLRKLWQDKYGVDEEGSEPAAKRLEVGDPFIDDSLPAPSPGSIGIGIAK